MFSVSEFVKNVGSELNIRSSHSRVSLPEVQDTGNLMNEFQGYDQSHEGSGDFLSDRVDGFIGNHSDCHRFSRYLIPDFSPLFRKNTPGLNDCVH